VIAARIEPEGLAAERSVDGGFSHSEPPSARRGEVDLVVGVVAIRTLPNGRVRVAGQPPLLHWIGLVLFNKCSRVPRKRVEQDFPEPSEEGIPHKANASCPQETTYGDTNRSQEPIITYLPSQYHEYDCHE